MSEPSFIEAARAKVRVVKREQRGLGDEETCIAKCDGDTVSREDLLARLNELTRRVATIQGELKEMCRLVSSLA